MKDKKGAFKAWLLSLDFYMIAMVIVSSIFGIIAIYSATKSSGSLRAVIVQSGCLIVGMILMLLISAFDYENFESIPKHIYIACAAILLLVFIPGLGYGKLELGSQSWINIPFINYKFQPSEFVKIGFILTFASHLKKVKDDINNPVVVLGLCAHMLGIVGIIMLQPDLGTSLVFLFIFLCMLFSAGINLWYLAAGLVAGGGASVLGWFFFMKEYQKNRLLSFLNPEMDPSGAGHQVIQSKIAIGSGGLWGKGFLQGTQTQLRFLPVSESDCIFSVIAEEFGFFGAIIVVALLTMIICRCFSSGKGSRSDYGYFICVGIGALFMFHAIENIGMCMGLLPVTGIPLPFFSSGGSALISYLVAVGLVLSVRMRRRSINF